MSRINSDSVFHLSHSFCRKRYWSFTTKVFCGKFQNSLEVVSVVQTGFKVRMMNLHPRFLHTLSYTLRTSWCTCTCHTNPTQFDISIGFSVRFAYIFTCSAKLSTSSLNFVYNCSIISILSITSFNFNDTKHFLEHVYKKFRKSLLSQHA